MKKKKRRRKRRKKKKKKKKRRNQSLRLPKRLEFRIKCNRLLRKALRCRLIHLSRKKKTKELLKPSRKSGISNARDLCFRRPYPWIVNEV